MLVSKVKDIRKHEISECERWALSYSYERGVGQGKGLNKEDSQGTLVKVEYQLEYPVVLF